jgi:hypothetical protein
MHPPLLGRLLVTIGFVAALLAIPWFDRAGARDVVATGELLPLRFEEVAVAAGVDFRHQPFVPDAKIANIAAHVGGLGASIAIVDVDRDGKPDLHVTSSRRGSANALYRNRGDGTFEDVAPRLGLAAMNDERGASMGAIFADLDGDFDPDGFLFRFGRPSLLRNDGERFTDVTARAGLDHHMNAPCASFLDYDRDGDLDLYVAGYYRSDIDLTALATPRIMQSSFEFADNGGVNRLFRNDGDLRFTDVTEQSGAGSTRWTLAVAAPDFDDDGYPDLYLANDYGPEELLLNTRGEGATIFARATDAGLSETSKSGMSVAVGDIRNDGRPSVFVTNICRSGYLFQGNNLRLNRLKETGRFQNLADDRGVVDCGWAWGAQFGDLDNDGWQDLFVVNEFISQKREKDYWFAMNKIAGGTEDFFEDATRWPAIEDCSLSGYETSRVLLNLRGDGFRDVATRAGVVDLLDGRGVAFGDLFDTGRLDAVIANQNAPVLIYRNATPAQDRHYVRFELRGKAPNTDAVGACVKVHFGGREQCQFVLAASGFAAQNDRRLHFGLGAAREIGRVVVRWPRGGETILDSVAIDRLHIIEEP